MCRACDRDHAKNPKGLDAREARAVCARLRSKVKMWWEKPVGSVATMTDRERLAELARQSRRLGRQPQPEGSADA